MLKPTNYNHNAATRAMFTQLPTDQDYQTKSTVYSVYPAIGDLCGLNECSIRTIETLSNEEKSRLKTILAHMCKKANQISKVSLAERSIEFIEASSLDATIKQRLLQSPQLTIQNLPSKGELNNAMTVLFALIIKDSYNFDQPTRWRVIEFISHAGELGFILDKIQNDRRFAMEHGYSFSHVYDSLRPAGNCAFFSTSLIMDEKNSMIPVFAFSSKDLKPLALSPELEEICPFNN